MLSAAVAWGQQPKPKQPGPLPLLPLRQAWTLTLDVPPSAGGALDAERVYIPLQSDQIIAIDREAGTHAWIADVESRWPPVAAAGMVFVAASDEVHGLDAATGARRWRAAVPREVSGAMGFTDGYLIVPMAPDQVIAYAAADGRVAWNQPLGGAAGEMRLNTAPGAIYISISSGRVVALNAATGAIRWDRRVPGAMTVPAVARDRVIVGGSDKRFYALDARSGKEKWKWAVGGTPVGAAADGNLVFLTVLDNTIRAVNRGNGHQRWIETLPTRPQHSPIAGGRLVAVPGIEPSLLSFAADKGTPLGTFPGNPPLMGPPLVDIALKPYAVAVVSIGRDGEVTGLRPEGMLFIEPPAVPMLNLPGRAMDREPRPDATRPR